jgi:hypothetical protein
VFEKAASVDEKQGKTDFLMLMLMEKFVLLFFTRSGSKVG